jgi:hypothetical protein
VAAIGVWGVAASIVAVRQALGVSTSRAITIGVTAVIGFVDVAALISLVGFALVVVLFLR